MRSDHSLFVCRGGRAPRARWAVALALGLGLLPTAQSSEVGAALRLGTLGPGVDVDFALGDRASVRLGYSGYSTHRQVNQTDITYDGTLKLSNPSAILDWYVAKGSFRLSLGAVASGTEVNAVGIPNSNARYTINGNVYSVSQLTSLSGRFKFGNSTAPYFGIGWGNPVRPGKRLSFLFDLGAIYGGRPDITLNASCSASVPAALCSQLSADIEAEKRKLRDQLTAIQWYPVVSVGLGYRF